MTRFFTYLYTFAALVIAASSVTSCSRTAENVNAATAPAAVNGNASGEPAKSEYPPLAGAIAQADIKNLDGSTFKIADRKGKVLLLNMWATWCGPCRSEMPALVRMQDKYRDQGFEVIGLDTDPETVEEINAFAKSMSLNYTLVWADTKLQNELVKISQFGGIPQSFLVDRDGNLRGVFKGANPADVRKMEELVGKVVNGESTSMPEPAANNSRPDEATNPATSEVPANLANADIKPSKQ